MSDGDGKASVKFLSDKENQLVKRKKKKLGVDEFSQAIARIAVAQVCEGLGFQSFQQSALDTLADVGARYIREIGKTAKFYTNLANRSECNAFDVIQGLEDLGSVRGFSGASDVSQSLSGSGVVRDIIRYVGQAEEIPFAYLFPDCPVVKERRLKASFTQLEENPPDRHVPSWLPKFPDPKTYTNLNPGNEKDTETVEDNEIQQAEEQQRKVEMPLLNLQHQSICSRSEPGVAVEQEDAATAQQPARSNPFLSPPLPFGVKKLSLPVLPFKLLDETAGHYQNHEVMENHVSALEPSLPANEAARIHECEPDDRRNSLLNGRPNVHFKFGNKKKSLGMVKRNEGIETISLWFRDDHEGKDEKKRRAEQILWDSMKNPHEISDM